MSFVSFALGVSLVLTTLSSVWGSLLWGNGSGKTMLADALKGDFRETASYRSYLCEMMNRFIAMGAGGPISGSYYDYVDVSTEETVLIEAVAISGDYDWEEYKPTEATKEQWKKEAQQYHEAIQNDRNILYIVKAGNEVLYTNLDSTRYDHANHPAGGYNTVLSFADGKCIVEAAGEIIPIYGEDNKTPYEPDSGQWDLPGYVNYPAGVETQGVSVYMAVADEPAYYVKPNYAADWSASLRYTQLYQLKQSWQGRRWTLTVLWPIQLGVGLALLGVYFLLRKEKPLADRAIARVTGHLWFELKLLLLLGALFFLFFPRSEAMWGVLRQATYTVTYEESPLYQAPWFLTTYLSQIAPDAILTAFWTAYLFVNDLRYGDRPWRHGVCGMLSARWLKLPVQKRFSRYTGAMILTTVVFCSVDLLLLLIWRATGCLRVDYAWVMYLCPFILFVLNGFFYARMKGLWRDLGTLTDHITAVKEGDLTASLPLPEDSDLRRSIEELNHIQQGMKKAVEEQTRSERMKVELVTNVSHDIKTPLTSIISYAELLKQENLEPPAGEYVDILAQKAERLRSMVLDIFEVSKAASGELPVKPEKLDLAKLLRQTMADMQPHIDAAPVQLRPALPDEPVFITADGDRLYRVFQNLLQNALQYALEGSRVYLSLAVEEGRAVVSVKNTSKTELPADVDFTARFVRGDPSRTDGGSGLGLAIAQSFTQACGGTLTVEPVADLFVVTVTFPVTENA